MEKAIPPNIAEALDRFAEVIDLCREELSQVSLVEERTYEYAIARAYSKVLLTCCEIHTLLFAGFPEGALALSRSLYEALVIIQILLQGKRACDVSLIERFFDAAEINKIKIYLDRVIWIAEKSSKNELAEKRRRAYSEKLESYKKKYGGLEFRNNYWWAKVSDFGELAEKSGFDKLPIYSRLSGNVHFNAYDVFTYICTEGSVLIGGTYNGIELPLWLSSFFLYCICGLLQNSYPVLISESTVEKLLSCAEYLSERYYAKIGVKMFQT